MSSTISAFTYVVSYRLSSCAMFRQVYTKHYKRMQACMEICGEAAACVSEACQERLTPPVIIATRRSPPDAAGDCAPCALTCIPALARIP